MCIYNQRDDVHAYFSQFPQTICSKSKIIIKVLIKLDLPFCSLGEQAMHIPKFNYHSDNYNYIMCRSVRGLRGTGVST